MPIVQSTLSILGFNSLNRREDTEDSINNFNRIDSVNVAEQIPLTMIDQVLPNDSIDFSKLTIDRLQVNEDIESSNFVTGSAGFKIQGDGNAEFSNVTIRGAISASTIDIGGADETSFHVDIDGNMWSGDANFASAPFKVSNTGDITATSVTVTGTINATGGYIGTTTALVYESQGLNCGVTGYIRGNQTDYHTGVGWFLGYSGGGYKFSIGNPDGNYMTWDTVNLNIKGNIILGAPLALVSYTVALLPTPPGSAGLSSPTDND